MSCEDLDVPVSKLASVRLRNYVEQRSSGLIKGWNRRFAIISANFLIVYIHEKVCDCLPSLLRLLALVLWLFLPPRPILSKTLPLRFFSLII